LQIPRGSLTINGLFGAATRFWCGNLWIVFKLQFLSDQILGILTVQERVAEKS
jgi:hypothetical protein